jgi:hypothetical protein
MTNLDDKPYPLTDAHFRAFGAIMHLFARFERLVEINIHQISGGRALGITALVISGLSYSAKVDALRSLLSFSIIGGNENIGAEMENLIREFDNHSLLRNGIAHHTWVFGDREGAVKPVSVSARGGKSKFRGIVSGERDYKLVELLSIERDLFSIIVRLRDLMLAAGAIPSMAENMETQNAGSNIFPEEPSK